MGSHCSLSAAAVGRRSWRLATTVWYAAALASIVLAGAHWSLPTVSSLIAATGLGILAYTDATEQHLPATRVRLFSAAITATLVTHGLLTHQWQPFLHAGLAGIVAAGVVGTLWWAVPGAFAFGDVRVTVLAVAAAAAVSWPAPVITLAVACVAGGVLAIHARIRNRVGPPSATRTVPFVPGLLLGFVAGVSLW